MTPFFFGPPAQRLYGVYHAPESASPGSRQVLLCPPFGQEAVRTNRLYRLLAEQLARQGTHVLRFDYFATGESYGRDEEGTLTQWQEDILLAHEELSRRTRATQSIWFGARLGATLAMLASAASPKTPDRLVLWEPLLDGPAYLKELEQAHAQQTVTPYGETTTSGQHAHNEFIGFGVGPAWIAQVQAFNEDQLIPRYSDGCVHIASEPSDKAANLGLWMQSQGRPWTSLKALGPRIVWHAEEANGAALAPPELLRQLIASVQGESA